MDRELIRGGLLNRLYAGRNIEIVERLPDAVWCPLGDGTVLVRTRTSPAEAWILSNTRGSGKELDHTYRITEDSLKEMSLDGFRVRKMAYKSVVRQPVNRDEEIQD